MGSPKVFLKSMAAECKPWRMRMGSGNGTRKRTGMTTDPQAMYR